jgi:hypothetical protein
MELEVGLGKGEEFLGCRGGRGGQLGVLVSIIFDHPCHIDQGVIGHF